MNLAYSLRTLSFIGLLTSVVNASNDTSFQGSGANETSFGVSEGANFEVYSVAASTKMNCTSGLRTFDPRVHKSEYVIGIHAIRGAEAATKEYAPVFAAYLTATAGRRFVPPITFKVLASTYDVLLDNVEAGLVDFFYGPANTINCVGTEFGAEPLATVISRLEARGHTYELDVAGGVIATRADNDEINSITDLKDKIIGAGSVSQILGGQVQLYDMQKAGMSYVMDPKQVVFAFNQLNVINGVVNREFDVGFFRADSIERAKDANGTAIDPDLFKIIEPKVHILDDGNLFPFLHSTEIYPEHGFAALDTVNRVVSREVQEALLAAGEHASLGRALEACLLSHVNNTSFCDMQAFPEYFEVGARCDTTRELATYAWEASKVGAWAGFRSPRSYFQTRSMLEEAGFMTRDDRGHWKCARATSLYETIRCPPGHYKRSEEEYEAGCTRQGLVCKEGYECWCKPCVKAFEVSVYEYSDGDQDVDTHAYYGTDVNGCSKMSVCGVVEQTQTITFRAQDNLERTGASVRVRVHDETSSRDLVVINLNSSWTYEFSWSDKMVGVGIVEIFFDDEQIPESPLRVQVIPRECDEDYVGQGRVPDVYGQCVCGGDTIELGSRCVQSSVFFVVIAAILLLVTLEAGFCFLGYKKRQNDQLWLVNVEELHFDDPVEVIGQGAFGVVLKAEYHGTTVAIKRVLSAGEKRRAGKTGSRDGSVDDSGDPNKNENASTCSASGSFDVEAQSASQESETHSSANGSGGLLDSGDIVSQSYMGSSDQLGAVDLDFLGRGFSFGGGKKKRWLPWSGRDENSKLKASILGSASGNKSRSSAAAAACPCLDARSRQKAEFIQEMRLLSRLRHPCITTVMGAVMGSGHDPMLLMEFCEYGSLHDLLRNETMYAGGEICLQIMRDVASGLRYLHSSKPPIFHGDLKAKNILIDSRFRAKVCDFGLSTKKKHGLSGTPYWMAPEYLRGKTEFTCACDVYSIGIILYEIYSRKSPYEGEKLRQVLRKVCDPRVNKRPPVPDCCPPRVVDIMKKCWSPDPFLRPQAKDLDMLFLDMTMQDAEPLSKEHQARTEKATGDMLYQVFPKHIADALKAGEKVEPESHENVTIVLSDIVHFTDISSSISPLKVSSMLDRLYLSFDELAGKHSVFKVETIGDAYMGVTNLNGSQENEHVKAIAEFAMDAVKAAGRILIDEDDPKRGYVRIRVGFHSGPVVSNVMGSLNPRYGLFGDTVTVASKMESNSTSRKIQCSERSAKLLAVQAPHIRLQKRGKIGVNGKGDMTTYWVGGRSKSKDKDGDGDGDGEKDKDVVDRPRVDFLADAEVLG